MTIASSRAKLAPKLSLTSSERSKLSTDQPLRLNSTSGSRAWRVVAAISLIEVEKMRRRRVRFESVIENSTEKALASGMLSWSDRHGCVNPRDLRSSRGSCMRSVGPPSHLRTKLLTDLS
jgi:hypothetical protein